MSKEHELQQKLADKLLKDMPDHIREKFALDAKPCGCGTNHDVLTTAIRNAKQMLDGDDCIIWHMLVHTLTADIYMNMYQASSDRSMDDLEELKTQISFMKITLMLMHNNVLAEMINATLTPAKEHH